MENTTTMPEAIFATPGLVVLTGAFARAARSKEELDSILQEGYGLPVHTSATRKLGDWLVASLLTRPNESAHCYCDQDGLTLLFDGYLTDTIISNPVSDAELKNPKFLLELYRAHGPSFVNMLRGSYVGAILDEKKNHAFLFNDRAGSRPLFTRRLDDQSIAFAPRVSVLEKITPTTKALNAVAIGEFLVRGCFYGRDTIFKEVEKVPCATHFQIEQTSFKEATYWTLRYEPVVLREDVLIDELDASLHRATHRVLRSVQKPALLLSGGLDSRLMLGYLLDAGTRISSFTYAVKGTAGDDHTIAARVAASAGVQNETYLIDPDDFIKTAAEEAFAADGRVQIIDAPSDRWGYIASRYSSMFIGDECFGWNRSVNDPDEALDVLGWWNIDSTPRISDWLTTAARKEIQGGIDSLRNRLVRAADTTNANDLKDKLYFEQRLGNLLNGFSARRLSVAEQARPFLDEDVVDVLSRVPSPLRIDKTIARKLMSKKFPVLDGMPYSQKRSVPWSEKTFIELVRTRPDLNHFILSKLSKDLDPRLGSIVDVSRVEKTASCLFRGEPLPNLKVNWWANFPGAWRFAQKSGGRVGALPGLLRLLQINLYLTR